MVGFVVNKVDFSEVLGVVPDMRGKESLDFFHLMFDEKVKEIIFQETSTMLRTTSDKIIPL